MTKRVEDIDIGHALYKADIEDLELVAGSCDDFPVGSPTDDGTWLHLAIGFGNLGSVKWLVSKGVDVNHRQPYGYRPLHSTIDIPWPTKHAILECLIAAGADLNARGMDDYTALHLAAIRDDFRAMEILLAAGADRSLRTSIDEFATPEEEARAMGNKRSADFIRDHGK